MITEHDVLKLASLARIELSDVEKMALRKDMDSILGYVADITQVFASAPTTGKPDHRNVFRTDEHPHESGVYTESLVHAAPQHDHGYVKVKKIL